MENRLDSILDSRLAAAPRSLRIREMDGPPGPLEGLAVSGNIETDDAVEIAAVKGFLAQTRAEQDEAITMCYSVTLVFPANAQADEFLAKTGWDKHVDSTGAFFDGLAVAKELGIEIQPVLLPFRGKHADRRLVEEVGIMEVD